MRASGRAFFGAWFHQMYTRQFVRHVLLGRGSGSASGRVVLELWITLSVASFSGVGVGFSVFPPNISLGCAC